MTSIADWLASLGLSEYTDRFIANAIDCTVLGELTEQDLKDLEIPLGHRRKMLRAIADSARVSGTPLAPEPLALPHEVGAQRRQLTVMFCDLVGSTALSAKLDPEDMRGVISAYHKRIEEIVRRHNGMIARYMGDGALIYFGYPQAREDETEQAVHAGLALVEAIPNLRSGFNVTLQVCIGIATGTVVVGDVLTTGSGVVEHAVVGDTPNLAARLQGAARPGTVIVCPNTNRLTDGYFEYQDLGSVAIKGWSDSVNAWQPIRALGVKSRFEAQHQARLAPLLGRDEETELLLRRWRSAKQGEGRAVLLTGEPGIGKSHIALALDELIRYEPHTTLIYYCSSHHANSSLFPYIGQLERAAGFERTDSPTARFSKLEAMLKNEAIHIEHAIALLGNLLSLPASPDYPLPALSPQKQKEATLAVLSALLDGIAARRPVLMVFEDVHWIDPTSLELLARTVERLPKTRILLLMTARPEFTPPWPRHTHISTLLLTRLSRQDGSALVKRVTGGKQLPEEVLTQILARTDGVPLFVEELTRAVLESGQLQERSGGYVLGHPLPSLAIPMTLHASLMARLDRLPSIREVAQIGAVIGREFSYELLSAVAGLAKAKLDDALDQLAQSELVFRRGTIPHAVYSFKHALVRDAAYAGLLKSRRAQLHAAIAKAAEQISPETAETQPEILAQHFTEAGLPDSAVRYWLQAGRKAAKRSAHFEAIAHLQKGLEAIEQTPPGSARDRTELDLAMTLGPCLIATQGPTGIDAVPVFKRARGLCVRLGDPPESLQVMFWLATASVMRGELPLARETVVALLDRVETLGDRPALINATRGIAMICMFMGQIVEAGERIERALETFNSSSEEDRLAARAAGQDAGVADLALMAWTFWLRGEPDTAAKRIDAALARAQAIDHPHSQAYACYYASVLYALRGEPHIAQQHAERCLDLSETHGFRQWHGLSRAIKGICVALREEGSKTLDDVKAAVEEYRNAGYQLGITALYVLWCPVLILRGQYDEAVDVLERGLAVVRDNSETMFAAELLRLKALVLRNIEIPGITDQPDSLLETALHAAREQRARSLELRVAHDLAKAWISEGKRDKARELLAPICESFKEGGQTSDLRRAKALLREL
ncbi:MAG TPA: adenylate/guanylate cyclase domain-containing protein [Pseudolabrys sp.]|nr:adenylate/guanylate cyclase domain-containing protein [Pseudolabrys sp.]